MHGIENDGKILKCNRQYNTCYCLFTMFSIAMKPQSGNYKIKFKINEINNDNFGGIVGIISSNCKNNDLIKKVLITNDKYNNRNQLNYRWYNQLSSFIGWCGFDNNNIFLQNKFIYVSNNENYKQRLPKFTTGDTIVLQYNSDLEILSFSKENDNGKLDSYIKNLPNDQTFHWFVGHFVGKMCLTVA